MACPCTWSEFLDSILNFHKTPFMKILFWLLLILGIPLYCLSIVYLAEIPLVYPTNSFLFGAAFVQHFVFMMMLIWMPASNFLINSRTTKRWIYVTFLSGCGCIVLLSCLTLVLIEPYATAHFVQDEYIRETAKSVANNKHSVPSWVGHVKDEKCCSWYGPYDFGSIYAAHDNQRFIESLSSKCFFKHDTVAGQGYVQVPKGCQRFIKESVKFYCERLFVETFIGIGAGIVTALVYAIHHFILYPKDQDTGERIPFEEQRHSRVSRLLSGSEYLHNPLEEDENPDTPRRPRASNASRRSRPSRSGSYRPRSSNAESYRGDPRSSNAGSYRGELRPSSDGGSPKIQSPRRSRPSGGERLSVAFVVTKPPESNE